MIVSWMDGEWDYELLGERDWWEGFLSWWKDVSRRRELKHIKECIVVVYIMVAYPAAVARTRNLQSQKELKMSLGPACFGLPLDVVS